MDGAHRNRCLDADGGAWRRPRPRRPRTVCEACDLVLKWKPLIGGGWTNRAGVGPFLERRMRERQSFVAREPFSARRDKALRAQSIRGRMAIEGLYVPEHAPWLEPLRSELLMFPAGATDDQVDALSLVGQLLDQVVYGQKAKPAEPRRSQLQHRAPLQLQRRTAFWGSDGDGKEGKDGEVSRAPPGRTEPPADLIDAAP